MKCSTGLEGIWHSPLGRLHTPNWLAMVVRVLAAERRFMADVGVRSASCCLQMGAETMVRRPWITSTLASCLSPFS